MKEERFLALPEWVLDVPEIRNRPSALLIVAYLWTWQRQGRSADLSEISEYLGICGRSVRRSLDLLESIGVLKKGQSGVLQPGATCNTSRTRCPKMDKVSADKVSKNGQGVQNRGQGVRFRGQGVQDTLVIDYETKRETKSSSRTMSTSSPAAVAATPPDYSASPVNRISHCWQEAFRRVNKHREGKKLRALPPTPVPIYQLEQWCREPANRETLDYFRDDELLTLEFLRLIAAMRERKWEHSLIKVLGRLGQVLPADDRFGWDESVPSIWQQNDDGASSGGPTDPKVQELIREAMGGR